MASLHEPETAEMEVFFLKRQFLKRLNSHPRFQVEDICISRGYRYNMVNYTLQIPVAFRPLAAKSPALRSTTISIDST